MWMKMMNNQISNVIVLQNSCMNVFRDEGYTSKMNHHLYSTYTYTFLSFLTEISVRHLQSINAFYDIL